MILARGNVDSRVATEARQKAAKMNAGQCSNKRKSLYKLLNDGSVAYWTWNLVTEIEAFTPITELAPKDDGNNNQVCSYSFLTPR